MTDPALVAKKLAGVESCLSGLRRLAKPEVLVIDIREQRFVERTLQIAIQAALDVASHIVPDRRLGEPRTHREFFALLQRDGCLDPSLAGTLGNMAGLGNVLVHGYDDVDLAVVRDVLDHHLGEFDAFVAAIRRALQRRDPQTAGEAGPLLSSSRVGGRTPAQCAPGAIGRQRTIPVSAANPGPPLRREYGTWE
jgi:uncharacterized protein YutE (UPF0331/DUF86 family)